NEIADRDRLLRGAARVDGDDLKVVILRLQVNGNGFLDHKVWALLLLLADIDLLKDNVSMPQLNASELALRGHAKLELISRAEHGIVGLGDVDLRNLFRLGDIGNDQPLFLETAAIRIADGQADLVGTFLKGHFLGLDLP